MLYKPDALLKIHDAWTDFIDDKLKALPWDWYVSLTPKDPISAFKIRGRFFWWSKTLRRVTKNQIENFWVISRQERGVFHVHAVLYRVPINHEIWSKAISLWSTYHTRGSGYVFGDAHIEQYDSSKRHDLAEYLAKNFCHDQKVLIGNGALSETMGWTKGVEKSVN